MSFTPQVHSKDAVFVQRDDNNTEYEQINISGSDAIVYLDSQGHVMADKILTWAALYGIGTGGSTTSASWASSSISSSFVPFNGNRAIKRQDPDFEGINVGGNNVVDFLENFFFPFIPATISINSGTTYYETGSSQNISIYGSITANDETTFLETTGSVKRDGVDWQTFPSASTYSVSDNPVIGASGVTGHSYVSYFSTDNDGSPTVINSSTKTITFIYPYLYGTSSISGLSDVDLYNALHKLVQVEGNKTLSIIGTSTYIYFCFPNTYDDLNSIKDKNGYEILTAFEYSGSVAVTSSGLSADWMKNYKVYRTKLNSDPSGNYTFTHS